MIKRIQRQTNKEKNKVTTDALLMYTLTYVLKKLSDFAK